MDDHVYEALARTPQFADTPRDELGVERLGGLTNLVYRVRHEGQSLCLRVPGQGTEAYIDREVEGHNARVAATAGVSPEVHYFDDAGVMLTRFLDGCVTMTPERFCDTPGAPARAAAALRRMHTCGDSFMCDLLWTLWGLIQHANNNPVDDFWAYSVNRFERCKALMGREAFVGHLNAVRQGD